MDIVSVIIPTYGGGEYIIRAIKSVLLQDYTSVEIITVDDNGKGTASQIITQERLQPFLDDSRLHYIVHNKNKNGAVARNTGFKVSKGKYIAFLDDDDTFLPRKLSLQVGQLESLDESWGMSYCSHNTYRNGKHFETVIVKKSGNILYEILKHEVTIGSSSLLVRRSIYENIGGFDESFQRHQDWEFTARVANVSKIVALPYIGFIRHLTFRNSPKSFNKKQNYMDHYLKKMTPLIKTLNKRKQEEIIILNQLSIYLRCLRKGKLKIFAKRFNELNAGFTGGLYVLTQTIRYVTKIVKHFFLKFGSIR